MTDIAHWTPVTGLLHWEQTTPDVTYLSQPINGDVTPYTWREVATEVRRMASHIVGLNLPAGSRIALLSSNCAHFFMADLAIWMAGHVSVPIYPSLNAETLRYILSHSEASLLFLGSLDTWDNMRQGVPAEMNTILLPQANCKTPPPLSQSWDELIASANLLEKPVPRQADELARLIYTSGSTGQPKGVMISFAAIAVATTVLSNFTTLSPSDRMISYLPLAHVFEAAVVEATSLRFGFQVFFSEGTASFADDLRRAQPTVFHSVPRLWVKFQQAVQATLPQAELDKLLNDEETATPTRQRILRQLGLQHTRIALTGSAPLPTSVIQWYHDLGLELLEGYAMSEDFAYSHCSLPGRSRAGYVGHALKGVERRIDETGEIQIKSPGCMMGYYKEPQKTAEAFTEDGWFRTGDLGDVDETGRLRITGRLKEIFKTSKGKYVAPAPIENRIGHPLVEAVCVSGANQPQPFVLIAPNALTLDKFKSSAARAEFESEIEMLLEEVNSTLNPYEKLAFAVIASDPWTIDNGMLTPTMKIRRNRIEAWYADRVALWYERTETVRWESECDEFEFCTQS